jgi:hypothetical protein
MKPAFKVTRVPVIRLALIAWAATAVVGARATAAESAAEESNGLKAKILLDQLDHPCGVAVRPMSAGELFVAESGAGRVLRVRLNEPPESTVAIEGFPRAEVGGDQKHSLGPLAVAFVDRTTLVVGEGGEPKGADVVRVYQLPDDGKTLAFDKSKFTLRASSPEPLSASEGDFFAIATKSTTLFAAGSAEGAAGWVFKADIAGLTAPILNRFIETRRETGARAPRAIDLSKRGDLVVAQAGDFGAKKDSVVCFYHAASGKRLLKLDTGLYDIVGLAFSKYGLLYAIDHAASDPSAGGLFRLDMDVRGGRQAIKAVRLLPLDRPAGLVIPSDRELFVTTFGKGDGPNGGKLGQLLKIEKTDGNF